MTEPVLVVLNGEPVPLPPDRSLAALLAALPSGLPIPRPGGSSGGIAVAVDGEVVPRGSWSTHRLGGGEAVEVVTAVQGG